MKSPKSLVYFCLVVFCSLEVYSQNLTHTTNQNLIPNPSFEKTKNIKRMNMEMRNFDLMADWKPAVNSPDVHHPDVEQVTFMHTSKNFLSQFGPQEARTGIGKAGVFISGDGAKEGVLATLKQKLSPGKYYFFQMYASLGEGVSRGCTSSIGAYFSARVPRITETSKLPLHVKPAKNICDTQTWTKICGVYKAKGTEKYMSIGYFGDSPKGKAIGGKPFTEAYYYIDDVLLIPLKNTSGSNPAAVCNMAFEFSDIEYLEGESDVYKEIKKGLESYIQYATAFNVESVQVIAFADDAGSAWENEIMAWARAANVKEYMIEQGVEEELIEIVYGADAASAAGDSKPGAEPASNNRVAINIE